MASLAGHHCIWSCFLHYFYFLDFFGKESIYGMRAGECVDCIHAWEEKGGCGTSEFCSECGAVNAVMNSQETGFDSREQ